MGQVVSQRELIARRGEWKRTGEGVVCAYGAFDLLHPGHVRLVEEARGFGKILAVGVQSDVLVRAAAAEMRHGLRENIANDRPITPEGERAEILAALSAVDFAAVVDEPLVRFLQSFRPDVYVCGDDPAGKFSKSNIGPGGIDSVVAEAGCKLICVAREPGYSTTQLIERISGRRA